MTLSTAVVATRSSALRAVTSLMAGLTAVEASAIAAARSRVVVHLDSKECTVWVVGDEGANAGWGYLVLRLRRVCVQEG